MNERIIINDGKGAVVIDMQVARQEYEAERLGRKCLHRHVTIYTRETEVLCSDCGVRVNAVDYLSLIVSEWAQFERAQEDYEEAKHEYEDRSRTKCEHCGKMTDISYRPRRTP